MYGELKLTRIAAAGIAVVLMALVLASCGGSSGSATTGTTAGQASASTAPASTAPASTAPGASSTAPGATSTGPGATAPGTPPSPSSLRGRVKALRECLSRNGVNLPKPGSGHIGLPPGVSKAQYEAALRKCAPNLKPATPPVGPTGSKGTRSGRFQKALEGFAACMRSHGVNLPPPNNGATGPIFNTKGINTQTRAFHAATAACRSTLRSALPGQPSSR